MTRMARVPAEVLQALDRLNRPDGVTLSELAHTLGRTPSSVQRALAGLLRDGVITAYVVPTRPLYRLSDTAPVPALLEIARWSLGSREPPRNRTRGDGEGRPRRSRPATAGE